MTPRPPQGSHATANQHTYIPQGAQQALARQMQQSVPAHLKQYVNNSSGYVPPRVQQELQTYMEAALPQHLQQYAGAYVEQNVVQPSMMQRPGAAAAATFRPNKPVNPRNLSHSGTVGSEQGDATRMLELFQPEHQRKAGSAQAETTVTPEQPVPQESVPAAPQPQPAPQTPPQYPAGQLSQPYHTETAPDSTPDPAHYDFIINPVAAPKTPGNGGGSLGRRLAVVGVVGVVLLIAVIAVSSLLKGSGGSQAGLVTVAQEQTELLRVANQAAAHSRQAGTLQLADATIINLISGQSQTQAYLTQIKLKVTPQQLALKHSAQTDTALNSAVATSTFDTTFRQVLQENLTAYRDALQRAYAANPGPKGRNLLKSQFDGAVLLLEQAQQS